MLAGISRSLMRLNIVFPITCSDVYWRKHRYFKYPIGLSRSGDASCKQSTLEMQSKQNAGKYGSLVITTQTHTIPSGRNPQVPTIRREVLNDHRAKSCRTWANSNRLAQ